MQISDEMLYQHAAQAREIWLDAFPHKDEIPAFSCSNRFQRKMNRLLRQQRRSPQAKRILRSMQRIVAVLLIAVTITFAGLMTVEAFREKVIEVVVHIYHELTRYEYSSDKEAAALPELYFDYLPEGMDIVSDETPFDYTRYILWEDCSGHYLEMDMISISNYSSGTQIIDTEDAQIATCIIQGAEVTIISKADTIIIVWTDDNAHYTIQSNLELSSLEAFIEGINKQS